MYGPIGIDHGDTLPIMAIVGYHIVESPHAKTRDLRPETGEEGD